MQRLYRSRTEVSADRTNIETILGLFLAIHEISKHVSPGHFDREFIENIIGNHISNEEISKVKETERENFGTIRPSIGASTLMGVQPLNDGSGFLGPVPRLFILSEKSKEPSHHALVAPWRSRTPTSSDLCLEIERATTRIR